MTTPREPRSTPVLLAPEINLMSDDDVREIADEVTDMGPTPTPRQWAAHNEMFRRGLWP